VHRARIYVNTSHADTIAFPGSDFGLRMSLRFDHLTLCDAIAFKNASPFQMRALINFRHLF